MAARKRTARKRSTNSARTPKVPHGPRRFRVLFSAQVGRAWQIRSDHTVNAETVATVLAPYLKNPKLTGASVTVQEVVA